MTAPHKTASPIDALINRQKVLAALSKGERVDGRDFFEIRPLEVQPGVVSKAEGSALVRLGSTCTIAGIKVSIGQPYPDTPDKGVLIVNEEILPLASPYIEPGPPGEHEVEIARVVDRGIRSSEMVPLEDLVIIAGQKVLMLFVDLNVLDLGGNLFDSSSYAAVTALLTTKIPNPKDLASGKSIEEAEKIKLSCKTVPISMTFAKLGDVLVLDPSFAEEIVASTTLTVTFVDDHICAVQKSGAGALTDEEIKTVVKVGAQKSKEIRKRLLEVISKFDEEGKA